MKRHEKGITTASVIVYIIAILFVISTLSVISTYFTKQIKDILKKSESTKTYTIFMSYFTQDIQESDKSIKNVYSEIKEENGSTYQVNHITFSNGNEYIYSSQDNSIYKNEVKICKNVDYCLFSETPQENNQTLIQIEFKTGDFDRTGNKALKFYI